MNLINDLLLHAFAEVTDKGVLFKGNYYTCSIALKEQWFYQASHIAGWSIPLFYDPHDDGYVLLQLANGHLCVGNKILEASNRQDATEYFQLIDKLKSKMKSRKGK